MIRRVRGRVVDSETLFTKLDRQCVRPVKLGAMEAWDEGESLTFGPLVVSRDGLRMRAEPHAWRDVERVEVSPVEVRITVTGRRGRRQTESFPLPRLPFVYVMLALFVRAGVRPEPVEGFVGLNL